MRVKLEVLEAACVVQAPMASLAPSPYSPPFILLRMHGPLHTPGTW